MPRQKFLVFYPQDYSDSSKAGKQYKPEPNEMLVMNNQGIFFLYNSEQYYPSIRKLSSVLAKYDVKWV